MEFFIEYGSIKEWHPEVSITPINTLQKLVEALDELKERKGEEVYYQIYVKDFQGNYVPVELDTEAIRWED